MKLKWLLFALLISSLNNCTKQNAETKINEPTLEYESGYDDFLKLGDELKEVRETRLIDMNEFLEMQKDKNTIVLDSRSKQLYHSKHLEGAINLPFTEYTQNNLEKIIPNKNTRILIYCNNNFNGDNINFASKRFTPNRSNLDIVRAKKPILLALNIPAFITLNGYGYENVFELKEEVDILDKRLKFEGSSVRLVQLNAIVVNSKK